MGLSQSRGEENAAGQRKSININCDRQSKPEVTSKKPDGNRSSSTMSSKNSRLRMIIPKRKQSKRKTTAESTPEDPKTSSTSSSTNSNTASPIVASFKTNMSSKFNSTDNNILNSYPRSTTILTLIGGTVSAISDDTTNGSRWYSTSRTRSGRQRIMVPLNIPSPVPSVSEHSEDNISLDKEDTTNPERETTVKNHNSMQTIVNDRPSVRSISICVAKSTSSSDDIANSYLISNTVGTNIQPERNEKNYRLIDHYSSDRVIDVPKKLQQSTTSISSHSTMGNVNTMAITHSESAEIATTTDSRMKRPNTLSPSKMSVTRSALARLCVGVAPLAQSECFVIENSPAVEFPPFRGPIIIPNTNIDHRIPVSPPVSSIGSGEKDSGYSDEPEKKFEQTKVDLKPLTTSRMQSRLKNPAVYLDRQRGIYNSHPLPTLTVDDSVKRDASVINATATDSDDSRADNGSPELLKLKENIRDSGIKLDSSISCSVNDNSLGLQYSGSKTSGSPEGSIHRGLIDDEIRDQPDLTFGCGSPERAEPHGISRTSTAKSEASERSVMGECGGPIRIKEKIRKHSSNRMNDSYGSTVSSLSIDSEDMMLDFDGLVDANGEEFDSVTHTCDNASIYSSLGRRRSRNTSGSGTGSWGRKKSKNLAMVGKRPSLEAVIDEWSSLKHDMQNESQNQTYHALVNMPPSSSSTLTTPVSTRILKPPVAVESSGLRLVEIDPQTYRHVVQDVTVMKTMLFRLKRILQEAETSNPFENSMIAMNGVLKHNALETETHKVDYAIPEVENEILKHENRLLRNQISMLVQQLEDQSRLIQCLQQQLKQYRRNVRKSDLVSEDGGVPEEPGTTPGSVFNADILFSDYRRDSASVLKGEDAKFVVM